MRAVGQARWYAIDPKRVTILKQIFDSLGSPSPSYPSISSEEPTVDDPRRGLLVIAFHYPPDNTSTGVLRTAKFTEYLLRHRWRSHVITVPDELYQSRNPAGLEKVPDAISVERTWACDVKTTFGIHGAYPGWLAVPDRYWPWQFTACTAGAKAIRRGGIDALYSTCPIPTAHLIGLRLKKRSGLPWIADFRDPWVEDSMPRIRRWLEGRMERKVIAAADRVICNTPAMRRAFLEAYPRVAAEKFVTITNGYDEADLSAVMPVRAPRFQILYPGVIDEENRNPADLLLGTRRALDRGWLREDDLEISFLGAGAYGESARFLDDVRLAGLQRFVNVVVERIPYARALARMAGADVVVLLSAHSGRSSVQAWTAMQVPAKLYEYLRLGRPMLAIVAQGAVSDLLLEAGVTTPIAPGDIESIASVLRRQYAERRPLPEALPAATPAISAYSREALTSRLALELDALVEDRDQRRGEATAAGSK